MWSKNASAKRPPRIGKAAIGAVLTAGLLLSLLAGSAAARTPSVWDGMAEGAALKLGVAARQLARTAHGIGADGRIGSLSLLRSDAEEVVRRADALTKMAQEPLPND